MAESDSVVAPIPPDPTQQAPKVNQPDLPPIYDQMSKARAAGYSWDEINGYVAQQRTAAKQAGYSDEEINSYLGIKGASTPPTPGTAGAATRSLGWPSSGLFSQIFGQPATSAISASLEAADGRPRTKEDMDRLTQEAAAQAPGTDTAPAPGVIEGMVKGYIDWWKQGPLAQAITAPTEQARADARNQVVQAMMNGFGPGEGLAKSVMPKLIPTPALHEFLDAATAVQKAGQGAPTLMETAQSLGQHFVDTGEHPIDAAARVLRDPSLKGKFSSFNPETGEQGPPINSATIAVKNPAISASVTDSLKYVFSPATRGDDAMATSLIVRNAAGQATRDFARSSDMLRHFGRAVAELSPDERVSYLDAIETGATEKYEGTPLGDLAAEMRKQLDAGWEKVSEYNDGLDYVQNYVPHIWENPLAASDQLAAAFGKRSLEGNKKFLRERVYQTIREGMQGGLKLKSDNPIDLTLMQLHQMNRYAAAQQIMRELKDNDILHVVGPGEWVPGGLTRIEDKVARTTNGVYYAPDAVATIVNRYLSPGIPDNMRPIYDTLRSAANTMNMAQLGLSGYHAGFVTFEAAASAMAKGVKQISRLTPKEIARGVGNVISAPVKPIHQYLLGRKVMQQYLGKANFGPETESIADAIAKANGRAGLPAEYAASPMGSFWESFRGMIDKESGYKTLGQDLAQMYHEATPVKVGGVPIVPAAVKATAQIVPRVMETIMAPLFRHYVPTMKFGVFADLMRDEMRVNPEANEMELRATASRLWNSVDNRLGELVYDNGFWNKMAVQVGQIALRALGWQIGDLREIPGGILDLAKGRSVKVGDLSQLSDKASYALTVPIATAMASALYGYLKGTWSPNWTLMDYMFPPTGGKDQQGGEERASMPGYLKDVYEYATAPLQRAANTVSPLWSTAWEMMNNRDWAGAAITDPRQGVATNAKDYSEFLLKQLEPIVMNALPPHSAIAWFENALGIKEAPYSAREPEREKAFENSDLNSALRKRAQEQAKQKEAGQLQ